MFFSTVTNTRLVLLLLLAILSPTSPNTIYSSHSDLQNLNKIESKLLTLLDSYIHQVNTSPQNETVTQQNTRDLAALRDYIVKYRGRSDEASYLRYPGNQYSLLYRFSNVWNTLDTLVGYDSDVMQYYQDCYFQDLLSDETDIANAASSIHRLQEMYGVPAQDLARGRSVGDGTGEELSVGVLSSLLSSSFSSAEWGMCEGWGQEAFLVLQSSTGQLDEYDTQVHWFDVATRYSLCLYKLGKTRLALEVTQAIARRYRYNAVMSNRKKKEKKQEEKKDPGIRYIPKQHPGSDALSLPENELEARVSVVDEKQYRALCRSKPDLPASIQQHQDLLSCYYKQNTARTFLQPIKCEVVWSSPRIVMFYDILSDQENWKIRELAKPRLERSVVKRGYAQKATQERISKVSWVQEGLETDPDQVIRRLNRRLEDATELSLGDAEALQVNNYGLGGMFNPHFDIPTELTKLQLRDPRFAIAGVRIATALVYLGEVEAGGATVFIDAGARIEPVKNSAAFWYNTLPSGLPDYTTQHAGCPVLAGNKWVINKWFDSLDQAFTRPCDIDQETRDKEARLYNGKYSKYDGTRVKKFKVGY